MSAVDGVRRDLAEESACLEHCVTGLGSIAWTVVTTPEGWKVARQIGHLHQIDALSWTGREDDFAVLAARRHLLADFDVQAEGPTANQGLTLVQTFAGPADNDSVRLVAGVA